MINLICFSPNGREGGRLSLASKGEDQRLEGLFNGAKGIYKEEINFISIIILKKQKQKKNRKEPLSFYFV